MGHDRLFGNDPTRIFEPSIGCQYDCVPNSDTDGVNNLGSIWRYLCMLSQRRLTGRHGGRSIQPAFKTDHMWSNRGGHLFDPLHDNISTRRSSSPIDLTRFQASSLTTTTMNKSHVAIRCFSFQVEMGRWIELSFQRSAQLNVVIRPFYSVVRLPSAKRSLATLPSTIHL